MDGQLALKEREKGRERDKERDKQIEVDKK
jgi:hypothetical protein